MTPRKTMIAVILTAAAFSAPAPALGPQASPEIEAAVWRGHEKGVTDVAFLPGGEEAVSCSLDGTVRLWETQTGRMKKILSSANEELFALSVSGDGRIIVTSGFSGKIGILSPKSGRVRNLPGIQGWSADTALSPDSRFAAVWSMDGDIRIFDVMAQKSESTLKGQANRWGMALAWSPDGRYLAAGRSAITLWDVRAGVPSRTLEGHSDFVRGMAFSPDGRRLATASMDKSVRVWDIDSGKALYTLEPSGLAVFTKTGAQMAPVRLPMTAAAFSPDGSKLATGGADRVVRLWSAVDGKPIREFAGHRMSVTAVEFSPDGRRIASASLDRTIRLWELD